MTRAERIEEAARLVLLATCIPEEHRNCPPMVALREALALPVTDQELLATMEAARNEYDRRAGWVPVEMEMVPVPPTSTTEAAFAPPADPAPPAWEVDETWNGNYLDGIEATERVVVRGARDQFGLADVVAYCFDRETADLVAMAPAMLGVLREVEWKGTSAYTGSEECPMCGAARDIESHALDCRLAAVLKGAP